MRLLHILFRKKFETRTRFAGVCALVCATVSVPSCSWLSRGMSPGPYERTPSGIRSNRPVPVPPTIGDFGIPGPERPPAREESPHPNPAPRDETRSSGD